MSEKPKKVQLFHTCLVNEFYPEVGMSVVNVLEHLGIEVEVPLSQTCCGQPAFNTGFQKEAKKTARYAIEVLSRTEGPIIIPSGSCTDMIIHQYPLLFQDKQAQDQPLQNNGGSQNQSQSGKGNAVFISKVQSVISRCYEFTQFLVDVLGVTEFGASLRTKAVYHPSCHLTRCLAVKKPPLALLDNIKDLEITEFEEQEECCGFGGVFSAKHPEISGFLMQKRIKNIEKTNAVLVTGCDMGCLMHLEGGLHRNGSPIKIRHIAQVLDEGLQ